MARALPQLEWTVNAGLEAAWHAHTAVWARERLLVVQLVAKHRLNAGQIAAVAGVSRGTVFRWLDKFQKGGVAELLHREHRGGKSSLWSDADHAAFAEQLRQGNLHHAKDAQAWLQERAHRTLALSTLYTLIRKNRRELKHAAAD